MPFTGPAVRKLATIAIINPETRDKMIINETDFDEAVHKRWIEGSVLLKGAKEDLVSDKKASAKKKKKNNADSSL